MTAARRYWVVDEAGDHALIIGAAERDRMVSEGWAEVSEPADDAFVHIWREGIPEPGRVPMSTLRSLWGPRGWQAGPPPGNPHPIPSEAVDATAEPQPTKPAANGDADKEGVTNG